MRHPLTPCSVDAILVKRAELRRAHEMGRTDVQHLLVPSYHQPVDMNRNASNSTIVLSPSVFENVLYP